MLSFKPLTFVWNLKVLEFDKPLHALFSQPVGKPKTVLWREVVVRLLTRVLTLVNEAFLIENDKSHLSSSNKIVVEERCQLSTIFHDNINFGKVFGR